MFSQFKEQAERVSAEVHRFPNRAEALAFLSRFLQEQGVADAPEARALWALVPLAAAAGRKPPLDFPGLTFDVTRELAAHAKIGISEMDWGLADTGTLVQDATSVAQRLVSSLPGIHVAILPTGRILRDLATLLRTITPAQSGYLAMITGPSRTADIERVLTIGVHGPERLIVLCVDEPEVAPA